MYTVSYFSRRILHLIITSAAVLLFIVSHSKYVFVFYVVVAIWLQMYLAGMNVIIEKGKLIKYSGNIFKRKTVFMLKNINYISTYTLLYYFPAFMKISFHDETVYILGFTGYQIDRIGKAVENI